MKLNKILATVAVAGLAISAFGQGLFLSNEGNTGGSAATSSGLVYIDSGTIHVLDLYNGDLGVELTGGLTSGSLSPIFAGTYTAATDPKGYLGWDAGQFVLGTYGASVNFPGATAGSTVYIGLKMWYNGASGQTTFANYNAAVAGLGYVSNPLTQEAVVFSHATSGAGSPPSLPTAFINMPSVILAQVPEPSTFVLAGLGMGAVWLLRRRK